MKYLSFIALLLVLSGCQSYQDELKVRRSVSVLTNSDVVWKGSFKSLVGTPNSKVKVAENYGKRTNKYLLSALKYRDTFVTAHYLLTKINLKEYETRFSDWNGMKITISAEGVVNFHPEQRDKLIKFWNEKL